MVELDGLDRGIIRLLQADGRMPFTQVADRVNVTEGTVRRRVRQLLDRGVMQIVAIVEPRILGWAAAAMIGVEVEAGRAEEVADKIASFPEVSYLFMVCDEFDLFAEIICEDREGFMSFLDDKLYETSGIMSARTFMILDTYKISYRWGEAVSHPRGSARRIAGDVGAW